MHYKLNCAAIFLVLLIPTVAFPWIYPEHRDIAVAAIEKLSPADQAKLEELWTKAQSGYPAKLCEKPSEGDQGLSPKCLDFAAIPAMTGDHSCSPKEVLERTLLSKWIFKVAKIAAETKRNLAEGRSRVVLLNALATSNLKFQVADPEYATRAGANNAHFLLPRTTDDLAQYTRSCFQEGTPLNALGLYGQYHVAALSLAQRLASGPIEEAERAVLTREAVILEGFSLHWLQDLYASGHIVGTWGSDAWRKGTHDYYNEFGVDLTSWKGDHIIVYGDANMKPADLERSAAAAADSLHQFLEAWTPGDKLGKLAQNYGLGPDKILAFDACKEEKQPTVQGPGGIDQYFVDQLNRMPLPARGQGEAHLPRFRDEMGLFLGVFGSLQLAGSWAGPAASGFNSSLAAGGRIGFGTDSLTGSVGTGIAFLEAGFFAASSVSNECSGSSCSGLGAAALFPGIPARTGLRLGMRLPFWLIPGDLLVLGPVLGLSAKKSFNKVMVEAGSGGLIPYERSFRTGAGIFQLVLGREVSINLIGLSKELLAVVPIGYRPDGMPQSGVVDFKSIDMSFPVIEWTPFRTFSTQLTFATIIQMGFGVGIPFDTHVVLPSGWTQPVNATTWSVFIRGQFDGRYFFGSREDLVPPR